MKGLRGDRYYDAYVNVCCKSIQEAAIVRKVILKMKVKQKNYVQEIVQDVSEALSSSCFCL